MYRVIKLLTIVGFVLAAAEANQIYRMCVPHIYFEECENVLKEPSQAGHTMNCIKGRDRMDCLEKVNQREADIVAVDPEDMYVAYHIGNQDFQVISEIRKEIEKDADYRYKGIILIKKTSDVKSLQDLKGKKSCHTGFGRNVGYKIPITKLRNSGVLKLRMDLDLTPTERELKALSEFFDGSCLVGTYSPHAETDQIFKKKYSKLCSICEKPEQCNYPDKFSGYDGAIRCLTEGHGDVAFTKTFFVAKYFGLAPFNTTAEKNPDDYEYLCEDGSRRPITGEVCSWAARPWQGYMTHSDVVKAEAKLHELQNDLDTFYKDGQRVNPKGLPSLLINSDSILHEKPHAIMPKEYLEKAGYKDVIERDGSLTQKVKLCVFNDIELNKCNLMKEAAYSRDIRPELQCVIHSKDKCIDEVKELKANAVVLTVDDYAHARAHDLEPAVFEKYHDDDVYVAVVDSNLNKEVVLKAELHFDTTDRRARYAARFLNFKREKPICTEGSTDNAQIHILNYRDLSNKKDKLIVCPNLELKSPEEYKTCNIEATLPNAVFIHKDLNERDKNNLLHAFISLSERFGHTGKSEDVFEIFDEFKPNEKNVIFNDNTVTLETELKQVNGITERLIKDHLTCQ